MAIPGTQTGGTYHFFKAYFSGPNVREYPHNSYDLKYVNRLRTSKSWRSPIEFVRNLSYPLQGIRIRS